MSLNSNFYVNDNLSFYKDIGVYLEERSGLQKWYHVEKKGWFFIQSLEIAA